MTTLIGNDAARAAFAAALDTGHLHHAWLLAGPEGVGKGTFARAAALLLLAQAVDPALPRDGEVPAGHATAALVRAGSHPDLRILERLPKDKKPDELARSITVDQVRGLIPMFATTPSLSPRRVVVIDAADELERPGASNALLKNLEEPPAGTIFFLVSHAPGRLLPTIRSRCRLLRFEPLGSDDMRRVLAAKLPALAIDELDALIRVGEGAPGRALRYAGLEVAALEAALETIALDGDRSNLARTQLAKALALKAAQPRYEAFLDLAPTHIAHAATQRRGEDLRIALDAHADARALAGSARGLSLDVGGTVFEMAGIVARLARAA